MSENNNEVIKVDEDKKSWESVFDTECCYTPLVDIFETDDAFILSADMPGVKKENVSLKLEDGSMMLFGKINYNEELNRRYILKEKETGHFFRKFKIADSIDKSKISANFADGRLTVSLPKHERIKPRIINIK
jgi:HSP20 family protein